MKLLFLLITLLSWLNAFSQSYTPISKGEIINHNYYTISYIEEHEQAEWVYYELTSSMISGNQSRTNNFRSDPKISSGSASLDDYKNSGYDRGHLAPAGDMKCSRTAMSESFYLSNMSPQTPSFNRGTWKELETIVRNWAAQYKKIYVVTGGILTKGLNKIGSNGVSVPNYYYKIIYVPSTSNMIAFLLPNRKITNNLKSYVVTTDHIEAITGIDFFSQLPDRLENILESSSSSSKFAFNTSSKINTQLSQNTGPTRCQAITKSGTRCKRKAVKGSKYCWQHKK